MNVLCAPSRQIYLSHFLRQCITVWQHRATMLYCRLQLSSGLCWTRIWRHHAGSAKSCSWSLQRWLSSSTWSMPSGCSCRRISRLPSSSPTTSEQKRSNHLMSCLRKTNHFETKLQRSQKNWQQFVSTWQLRVSGCWCRTLLILHNHCHKSEALAAITV